MSHTGSKLIRGEWCMGWSGVTIWMPTSVLYRCWFPELHDNTLKCTGLYAFKVLYDNVYIIVFCTTWNKKTTFAFNPNICVSLALFWVVEWRHNRPHTASRNQTIVTQACVKWYLACVRNRIYSQPCKARSCKNIPRFINRQRQERRWPITLSRCMEITVILQMCSDMERSHEERQRSDFTKGYWHIMRARPVK